TPAGRTTNHHDPSGRADATPTRTNASAARGSHRRAIYSATAPDSSTSAHTPAGPGRDPATAATRHPKARAANHDNPSGRRGATSASAVPETGTQGANRGGVAALGLRSCYSATRDQ
ncbi:MAG: hypothetical protein WA938_01475, partial [Candidatus Dormiibacterota bacterium]